MSPVTPPGSAPITRTFAARDDLVEWTRKIASVPPPAEAEPGAELEPDRTPPPSVPPTPERPEPATQPAPGPKRAASTPARRFPTVAMGVGLALLAAFAAALHDAARPPPLAAPVTPIGAASLGPSGPVAAAPAARASEAQADDVPSPVTSALPRARSVSSRSELTALHAPRDAAEASAQLKLTADPPSLVTVLGGKLSQTHTTPVRALSVPPGSYSLTFRSPTFGEPVVARVELAAGVSRSVHADFRAAIPTVAVR